MKLDLDCVRSVMLELEKQPYGEEITIEKLINVLSSKYKDDDISYSLLKLHEANYINASLFKAWGTSPYIDVVYDITYDGHEFLNNIRPDKIWDKTKSILLSLGVSSISFASKIAVGVITELIKQSVIF